MCYSGPGCQQQQQQQQQQVHDWDWSWLTLPDNHTLGHNTWVIVHEDNRSIDSHMVTQSGRTSVVLFGGFLSAWALLFNLLLICLLCCRRRRRRPAGSKGAGGRGGRVPGSGAPGSPPAPPCYPGRWLLLNFSLAQLMMGGFVIPLNVVTERAGAWKFGPVVCRVWLGAQVLFVSLTVWALFVLTLDRFIYVVQPVAYARRMGRKSVVAGIAGSWSLALATLIPMVLSLDKPDILLEEVCAVRMTRDHAVTMSFAVFLAPALLTLTATVAIVIAALQAKVQQHLLRRDALGDNDRANDEDDDDDEETKRERCGEACVEDCCCSARAALCSCCLGRCCPNVSYVTYSEYSRVGGVALVVVLVNVVSLAMWCPFYVTNVLIPFCRGMCVNPQLWSLFIWLGYSNAGVAPVLWLADPDIRLQLKALLYCRKAKDAGQQYSQEKTRLTAASAQAVHL